MTTATRSPAADEPWAHLGPTPDERRAQDSPWTRLRARVPGEGVPSALTGLALAALVVVCVVGWAAPTTGFTLAVVVIGVRAVVDARSGRLPSGLVVAAVALTLVLAACWWAGTDLDHAPRWRTERPTSGLASYEVAAGSLTVDLTDSPRPVGVRAEVGVGRVIVKVPDADVRAGRVLVRARVGGGWASVPVPRPDDPIRPVGRDAGPALVDEVATEPGADPPIVVDVAVGVGSVEVQRVR